MSEHTFTRRFSLAMLLVDTSLASWMARAAWGAIRTGPRRTAVRMVMTTGCATAVAAWRYLEYSRLIDEQRNELLDQILDHLEDTDDELDEDDEDDSTGWIFDERHPARSEWNKVVDELVDQRFYPLSPVAPPPALYQTSFAPYLEDSNEPEDDE